MKKLIVFALLAMATFSSLDARADNASVGTVAGVIGGAAVGHAVGHNSQGTLLGAAVGGVFGYIIGNEMDRGSNVRYVYPDNRRPVYVVEPPYRRPETVVVVDRYIQTRPYPQYQNVVFVPEQRYYPGHNGYNKHHKQGKHSRWGR